MIVPTVISSEFPSESFDAKFVYTGTRNYNAMLAISAAISFRERLGDSAIMQYNRDLAWNGANRLKEIWNTELLAPREMNSAIINVRLPTNNGTLIRLVRDIMLSQYNTYIQTFGFQNGQWIRISSQIYLELSDIVLAGQRILQLIKQHEIPIPKNLSILP